MIQIAKTGGKLAASGTWSGNHHYGTGSHYIFIGTVAFVTHNFFHIGGIALCGIMQIYFDTFGFEFIFECRSSGLVLIACNDYSRNIYSKPLQVINTFQGIHIVGNSKIGTDFISLNITGINTHNDVDFVLQLLQQAHLHIGIESRQNPGSMVIIQNFSSAFQIEFIVEPAHPVEYSNRLLLKVFLVIKTNVIRIFHLCCSYCLFQNLINVQNYSNFASHFVPAQRKFQLFAFKYYR